MATRNRLPIELIWVLVNLGSPQINALTAVATTQHRARVSGELSVNRNASGTQALIKIASSENGFRTALTAAARGAIMRVFTEADHDEAVALVTSAAWIGQS